MAGWEGESFSPTCATSTPQWWQACRTASMERLQKEFEARDSVGSCTIRCQRGDWLMGLFSRLHGSMTGWNWGHDESESGCSATNEVRRKEAFSFYNTYNK
eukprot:EG_transcript_48936